MSKLCFEKIHLNDEYKCKACSSPVRLEVHVGHEQLQIQLATPYARHRCVKMYYFCIHNLQKFRQVTSGG